VNGFGDEWTRYDQSELNEKELQDLFQAYFGIFPWEDLPPGAVGFDMGCGSGRWARLVAPRIGKLLCIDASHQALSVARRNLQTFDNCELVLGSFEALPLADGSMDFGYCLGVLHHVPDPQAGIEACVQKLKPGAPFLVYMYYAFDNRPPWFRALWRLTDLGRRGISRLPTHYRHYFTLPIALLIYLPLARFAAVLEAFHFKVDNLPLAAYRRRSFYTMKTDALDRFGTVLEKRFTAGQIEQMLHHAGLRHVTVSSTAPYWCCIGWKESTIQ
jgi:ubiquinone/menaquinone biosynthesis C-methylase UbiE